MANELMTLLSGEVLDEEAAFTLGELSRICRLPAEAVVDMVDYGLIEPRGRDPKGWRFSGVCIRRVQRAQRLRTDLGINLAGAALVLELLDELEWTRDRLRRLEGR